MAGRDPNRNPKITAAKFARLQWGPQLRERKTITDYLATALRTAIYDGQFADQEELNQVELANFFGTSRVPIREALRQLQAEGLVQNIAHHRTIVTGLSLPDLLEAVEMRAVLEAYLLRKAARKMDKADLGRLGKLCDEADRIKDYGSQWVLKNWDFHRLLYSRSDSPRIVSSVESLQLNIERYARRAGSQQRLRQAADEHRQILKALQSKDIGKACALLERHIMNTGEDIRRSRASKPAPLSEAPVRTVKLRRDYRPTSRSSR